MPASRAKRTMRAPPSPSRRARVVWMCCWVSSWNWGAARWGSGAGAWGCFSRWGRWTAPFETVRRYLVTGQIEAGRNRKLAHDMIVTAMTQIRRWGADGVILGDQPEWQAARAAVSELMERYARGAGPKLRAR